MLSTFQKAVLGVLAGSALLIALVLGARGPASGATPPSVTVSGQGGIAPGIVTTGEATVKVKPDLAILSVGATAQAPTAAEAQALVAQRIERILAAAKALGIADGDVATAGYGINPLFDYGQNKGSPKITGYQGNQMLTLKLRDIAEAGKALDALVRNEAATNASLQFSLEDPKPTEAKAREMAIKDAQAKAEAMAKTAGVGLGKIIAIGENVQPIPFKGFAPQPQMGAGGGGTQVPVGELEVRINVQVQFAIQ